MTLRKRISKVMCEPDGFEYCDACYDKSDKIVRLFKDLVGERLRELDSTFMHEYNRVFIEGSKNSLSKLLDELNGELNG